MLLIIGTGEQDLHSEMRSLRLQCSY